MTLDAHRFKTVVLIEDGPDEEVLISRALDQTGLSLHRIVARDGAEAVELFRQLTEPPSLVLCDLKLPKLGGAEVVEFIRTRSEAADAPVVIFTSSDEERDIRRCHAAGADSYVVKPVDFQRFTEVVGRVRPLLARMGPAPNSPAFLPVQPR